MEGGKMKILHVIPYHPSPSAFIFAKRQIEDLDELGHSNEIFYFKTSFSVLGFFRQLKSLKSKVKESAPDLVHAHYGTINAFFASQIPSIPLVVSFHGSDINYTKDIHWLREKLGKFLSFIAAKRARKIICVSEKLQDNLPIGKEKSTVLASGINTRLFRELDMEACKAKLGLAKNKNYIFFNSNNPVVKRLDIANEVVVSMIDLNVELLSLNGNVEPNDIPLYLNACVACLLCSDSEGSPMVIKEAMACGLPIVSVDVGDVRERIRNIANCFIVPQDSKFISEKLRMLIALNNPKTNGLDILKEQRLDYLSVAKQLENIYFQALQIHH
jgi:teichuronic acid biosynthesis glycosyltransferase TuaC